MLVSSSTDQHQQELAVQQQAMLGVGLKARRHRPGLGPPGWRYV